MEFSPIDLDYIPLTKRCISVETCQHFRYGVGEYRGKKVQVANYFSPEGDFVAQKVRLPDKTFAWVGDASKAGFFGQQVWKNGGQKKLVVTEGEIDMLSVGEIEMCKWPVVSLKGGSKSAEKEFREQFEWLESFDEVILMFDTDEPGKAAAEAAAQVLSPGRVKVAALPLKDANECLQAGRGQDIARAKWDAKVFRPDGILNGAELFELVSQEDTYDTKEYPFNGLNNILLGLRPSELVTFTAGSGIGKSAIVREIAHHLIAQGETVGMLMLEESIKRTALGLMGIHANHPLHIDREGVSDEAFKDAFDATLGTGRVYLFDHFGSTEIEHLMFRLRYMVRGLGCKWIILDHLSIVVSGLDGDDERRLIDRAMTLLRTFIQETGVGLILVSHLKRPQGQGHEEGAQTSLSQLRGSHAIAQLSDIVIGAERDQQGEEPNITTLRILKNRFTGETGIACRLEYTPPTGRLSEVGLFASRNKTPITDPTDNNSDF